MQARHGDRALTSESHVARTRAFMLRASQVRQGALDDARAK